MICDILAISLVPEDFNFVIFWRKVVIMNAGQPVIYSQIILKLAVTLTILQMTVVKILIKLNNLLSGVKIPK